MFYFRSVPLILLLLVSISEVILGQEKQKTTSELVYSKPVSWTLPVLIPFRQGALWGYADSTGRIRIKPRFTAAEPFKNGRAIVMNGEAPNVIDTAGTVLFNWDLYSIYERNDMFFVRKNFKGILHSQSGVFDKNGKTILPIKYYSTGQLFVRPYADKPLLYASEDRRYQQRRNLLGRPRKPRQTFYSGIFDVTGKTIIPLKYLHIRYLGAGVIVASKGIEYGTSFFYFNPAGKRIKALKGYQLQEFRNGLALAKKKYKQGFVASTGRVIAALKYNEAKPFSEGLAAVRETTKWGYIDTKGKEFIPYEFDAAEPFNRGFAVVKVNGEGYGLIDRAGKRVSDFHYDEITTESEDKTFYFYKKGVRVLYGYCPEGSKEIFFSKAPVYFFKNSRQFGEVQIGDSIGYMDETGKMLIRPMYLAGNAKYYADPAIDGLLAVKNSKGWGVVNLKNEVVIPFGYKWVRVLNANRFLVSLSFGENQWKVGMIDSSSKEIIPPRYYKITTRYKYLRTLPYGWLYAENAKLLRDPDEEISIFDIYGRELMHVTIPEGYHALSVVDQGMLMDGLIKIARDSDTNHRNINYLDWKGTKYFQD